MQNHFCHTLLTRPRVSTIRCTLGRVCLGMFLFIVYLTYPCIPEALYLGRAPLDIHFVLLYSLFDIPLQYLVRIIPRYGILKYSFLYPLQFGGHTHVYLISGISKVGYSQIFTFFHFVIYSSVQSITFLFKHQPASV